MPRPPLRVVVNVGANHKVTGSLVLLFEEAVASQVSVGSPTGPSSMYAQSWLRAHPRFRSCHCTGRYQNILPIHQDIDRCRLGCHPIKVEMGMLAIAPDEMASLSASSYCGGSPT